MSQSKHSLLIDADVLLFRDPFEAILSRPQYAVQWQAEQATHGLCDVEPNGGLLYVRNDGARFFEHFYRNKDVILNAKAMSETDQAFILPSVIQGGLEGCALPSDVFVGKCQYGRDGNADLRRVVSFHANCARQKQKKKTLERFLLKVLGI